MRRDQGLRCAFVLPHWCVFLDQEVQARLVQLWHQGVSLCLIDKVGLIDPRADAAKALIGIHVAHELGQPARFAGQHFDIALNENQIVGDLIPVLLNQALESSWVIVRATVNGRKQAAPLESFDYSRDQWIAGVVVSKDDAMRCPRVPEQAVQADPEINRAIPAKNEDDG